MAVSSGGIDERKIEEIVSRVIERLGSGMAGASAGSTAPVRSNPPSAAPNKQVNIPRGTNGIYADADQAVKAARRGFEQNEKAPVATRMKMIEAMRRVVLANNDALSRYAVEETGLGRYEDKLAKNKLVAEKTPGCEILRPVAYTGDDGLMLTERAPYGVLLAVTPTNNPTETILCNAIGMVAAGNAVVFNVHPAAAQVCNWCVHLLNEAIQAAGGPRDVIVSIERPTIEGAQFLMKHPLIRMIVVTGGPGVVKQAMDSGKKVIAGGPGNPPAIVDDTANLDKAADAIVRGASLDNNIVCIAEKEIVAVDSIASELVRRLQRRSVLVLDARQTRELEKVILEGDHLNKRWVGKDAGEIAKQIGIGGHGHDLRLLLCEVDEGHPFVQHELLMPVIPLFRVRDTAEAIAAALRVEHGFHHTATMHSLHVDNMAAMARLCNCSIFVKNEASYAGLGLGGEGYTSFTIASPTGEGLTTAMNFSRERRSTLKEAFSFA
ncbi:MAG TPA: aldehyde dehydrogenase family protein [Kofleriaceae bacterium]|jgi:acyl-CoA reductase-like NAD-dependent aldehyde dehydrogenase|nr:aldehyde dehydrogenase family protein [Kofleriaceae bacterium]